MFELKDMLSGVDNKYAFALGSLIVAIWVARAVYKKSGKMFHALLLSTLVLVVGITSFYAVNFIVTDDEKHSDPQKNVTITSKDSGVVIYNEYGEVIVTKTEALPVEEVLPFDGQVWWKDLELPQKDHDAIQNVLDTITSAKTPADLKRAEKLRQQLRDNTPLMLSIKINLKAAINLAGKDYKKALEAILERYNTHPRGSLYNRWEFAWTINAITSHIGFAETEKIITELKEQYEPPDLSYAWLVVSHATLSNLYRYRLRQITPLTDEQRQQALYLLAMYPDNEFNDHILFCLEQYEDILANYPDSSLADKAYYQKYRSDLESTIKLKKTGQVDGELKTLAEKFFTLTDRYSKTELHESSYRMTARALAAMQDSPASQKLALTYYEKVPADYQSVYLSTYFENLAPKQAIVFADTLETAGIEEQIAPYYYIRQSAGAFEANQYELALQFYDFIPSSMLNATPQRKHRITTLKRLVKIEDSSSDHQSKLYQKAMALKESKYDTVHAVPYFYEWMINAPEEDKARTLMLIAFCYRDDQMHGDKMLAVYKELIEKYPDHPLADDAMAEIGVYHLLWGWNQDRYQKARFWFARTIAEYPDGNAVDNCYNWIAWSYLKEENWLKAIEYYQLLIEKVPTSRFVDYAKKNLKELVLILMQRQFENN